MNIFSKCSKFKNLIFIDCKTGIIVNVDDTIIENNQNIYELLTFLINKEIYFEYVNFKKIELLNSHINFLKNLCVLCNFIQKCCKKIKINNKIKRIIQLYNSGFKKFNLHTFGDSHCFIRTNPNVQSDFFDIKINHLGPKLMFSIGNNILDFDNYNTDGIIKNNIKGDKNDSIFNSIKDGDFISFHFGEIDCRCHVHKHISKDNTYKEIIENLVEKYINNIFKNCNKFKNLKVLIFSVVPPQEIKNVPINHINDNLFPYLGTDDERLQYVLYMNNILEKKCKENNFEFVNIYEKYSNSNGFFNLEYRDYCVHVKNPIFINELLNNIGYIYLKKYIFM